MAINFLQLLVHRQEADLGHPQPSHAKVVASAPDLFQALERAVNALHQGGWIVDDLEKFLIGISRPSAEADELLTRLYQEAKSIGVAWAIVDESRERSDLENGASQSPCSATPA